MSKLDLKPDVIKLSMLINRITSLLFFDMIFPRDVIIYILLTYYKLFNKIKFSGNVGHSLCLNYGTVYGTGINSGNILGIEDIYDRCHFSKSNLLKNLDIVNVSTGVSHSIVQTRDGNLYGFGTNKYGQLGLEDERCISRASVVKLPIENVLDISCGDLFSIVLTKNGLLSTGNTDNGCLGRSDFFRINSRTFKPIIISNVINFKCSACTVFIQTKDGIFSHGNNACNQLGLSKKMFGKIVILPNKIDIEDPLSFYNGPTSSLILTKDALFLCDLTHDRYRIETRVNIIQALIVDYAIYYSTEDGVYSFNFSTLNSPILSIQDSIFLFSKPVLSIQPAPNGLFIETYNECYGIGSSEYGELGTCFTSSKYQNIPTKIVFK
jgi:hypothetical protein